MEAHTYIFLLIDFKIQKKLQSFVSIFKTPLSLSHQQYF